MKKIGMLPLLLSIACLMICCTPKQPTSNNENAIEEYTLRYARGFSVNKYANFTKVVVHNPWDTTQILQTYILVAKNKELPSQLPKGKLIRTPLSNVVAYSTIHCSTLNELKSLDIIKGVCEPEYINVQEIKQGVKNGTIKNFGVANSPDVEQILLQSPEAIFATPIVGQSYGNVEKIGIPIIEILDYTEPLPLGSAEWIRFYSLFVGQEQLADSLFANVADKYNDIKQLVSKGKSKPTVFVDQLYLGTWNMPGGKSCTAIMLDDAGGHFIWSDNNSTKFLPLSFESVLDKASEADLWLVRYHWGQDMTYASFKADYKPYSYFEAYKQKNIWGCNTSYSTFYEDWPIHPEKILKDFAYIFNPDLFPNYTPLYFKKLNE